MCYGLARMSDSELGRRLARLLGREWCPRCGRFLDYRHDLGLCLSCHLSDLRCLDARCDSRSLGPANPATGRPPIRWIEVKGRARAEVG